MCFQLKISIDLSFEMHQIICDENIVKQIPMFLLSKIVHHLYVIWRQP